MKILDDIYVVGGGIYGIGLSTRLDCNVYLVDCGTEYVLIDAGVGIETEKIIKNITEESLDVSKIKKLFLTHAHLDHSGGAANLKKMLNLEVYVSEKEAVYLESGNEEAIGLVKAKEEGVYPKDYKLSPVKIDSFLKGGEEIKVGKYIFKIISTPGHSKGCICFLLKRHEKKIIFSGDTVFLGGFISLLNLPDSSLTDYANGIKNLKNISVDSLIPAHYGFTLNNGQYHIDTAIDALSKMSIPKMI